MTAVDGAAMLTNLLVGAENWLERGMLAWGFGGSVGIGRLSGANYAIVSPPQQQRPLR